MKLYWLHSCGDHLRPRHPLLLESLRPDTIKNCNIMDALHAQLRTSYSKFYVAQYLRSWRIDTSWFKMACL